MQAVIKVGTSQYLISEGQEFLVDLQSNAGDTMTFSDVLLVIDGDNVQVGQPTVSGFSVFCDVVGQVKGDKVVVSKFKAKSRYRKTVGFRPKHTKLKVTAIGNGPAPKTEKVEKTELESKPKAPRAKKARETKS